MRPYRPSRHCQIPKTPLPCTQANIKEQGKVALSCDVAVRPTKKSSCKTHIAKHRLPTDTPYLHNTSRAHRRARGSAASGVSHLTPAQRLASPLVWTPVFARLRVVTLLEALSEEFPNLVRTRCAPRSEVKLEWDWLCDEQNRIVECWVLGLL